MEPADPVPDTEPDPARHLLQLHHVVREKDQNRRFRFDLRFRALVGGHRSDVIQQIEEGFPRLPSGCAIQLDRVASRIVLENVRASVGSSFAGLVAELRAMAEGRRHAGGDPSGITLADFFRDAALEPEDLYKTAGWTWSRLRREAGLTTADEGLDEAHVARALPRLLHLDDPDRLALYKRAVTGTLPMDALDPDSLFHWESQSTTSVQSPTGQRYLNHRTKGTHVFLFVRHRKHEAGRTAAYTCLGAADYVSHERSRPIAMTWRLRKPMPDDFFREAKIAAS